MSRLHRALGTIEAVLNQPDAPGANQAMAAAVVEAASVPTGSLAAVALMDRADTDHARLLSFALGIGEQPGHPAVALAAYYVLCSGPARWDVSTALNLTTWIQRVEPGQWRGVPALVRRAAGAHLVTAIDHRSPLVGTAAVEALLGLRRQLSALLCEEAARRVLRGLEAMQAAADDDSLGRDVGAARAAISQSDFADSLAASVEEVAAIRGDVQAALDEAGAGDGPTTAALALVDDAVDVERAVARALHADAEVVRLRTARWSGAAPPPIEAVADLLGGWAAVFRRLWERHGSAEAVPELVPYAGSHGSFTVSASVARSEGTSTTLHAVQRLLEATQHGALVDVADSDAETLRRMRGLLRSQERHKVVLGTAVVTPRADVWGAHTSIDPAAAEAAVQSIEQTSVEDLAPRRVVGRLVAANIHTGDFTVELEDSDPLQGKAASGELLRDAVLGRAYSLRLEGTRAVGSLGDQRTWCLVDLAELDDDDTEAQDVAARLSTALGRGDVPQASVGKIIKLVDVLAATGTVTPVDLQLQTMRALQYYLSAARLLGLVRRWTLTRQGWELARAADDVRYRVLAARFADSRVGVAWARWAGVASIAGIDPSTAEAFLRAESSLTGETLVTRAGHLQRWWLQLAHHHYTVL